MCHHLQYEMTVVSFPYTSYKAKHRITTVIQFMDIWIFTANADMVNALNFRHALLWEVHWNNSFTIYCQLPYVPYHSYSVTLHACAIVFHYYKLLESPCLSLSSVGAALHPHDSCSFSFSRILKKREHSGKQGKANYGQVHSPGRQPISIRVYFWGAGSKLKPILWNS